MALAVSAVAASTTTAHTVWHRCQPLASRPLSHQPPAHSATMTASSAPSVAYSFQSKSKMSPAAGPVSMFSMKPFRWNRYILYTCIFTKPVAISTLVAVTSSVAATRRHPSSAHGRNATSHAASSSTAACVKHDVT